jgi:hypothetical protein
MKWSPTVVEGFHHVAVRDAGFAIMPLLWIAARQFRWTVRPISLAPLAQRPPV